MCGCSLRNSFSSLYVGKKCCDKIGGGEYHHKSPKPQREERQKSGFNSQYFAPIFTLGTDTAGDRLGDPFHAGLLRLVEQSSGRNVAYYHPNEKKTVKSVSGNHV